MKIACFVSGSGTNYREIAARDPDHDYLVFTNHPGCGGAAIARKNGHPVIELNSTPYLREVRKRCGPGAVPRNCPERETFEKDAVKLIEGKMDGQPDLICLAGYDLVNTDWFVDRYFPRVLNIHPGDSSKGYFGLHWIPAARAILNEESGLRSTLFFIDKGLDTGPILSQSAAMDVRDTLTVLEARVEPGLHDKLKQVLDFAGRNGITNYERFKYEAPPDLNKKLETVCTHLQEALKAAGDWKVYPYGVHDLIGASRVEIDGRDIWVDGSRMPVYGFRPEENRC